MKRSLAVVAGMFALLFGAAAAQAETVVKLTQMHNCCGACTKAIKAAIKEVPGVVADTCKSKQKEFVIEGDFDAKAVVTALYDAGFHVSVK